MTESKIELTERLRREGRWAEASKLKDTALADFRAKGMKRDEAGEAAWSAMEEAYPPLPVVEGPADPAAPEAVTIDAAPIPWSDLPTEADFDEEVRWVHQQFILIVEETPRSRVIHWERATRKPPSTGTCSLARWAADNRTAFYKDLLPRTMAKASVNQEDEAAIREEKLSIQEIEGIVERMSHGMDEEELQAVPEFLQQRVRDLLSNWVQKWGVSLGPDARACLDSAIVGLLRDSLRAFAHSSGGE